jgi:hypothetical protein
VPLRVSIVVGVLTQGCVLIDYDELAHPIVPDDGGAWLPGGDAGVDALELDARVVDGQRVSPDVGTQGDLDASETSSATDARGDAERGDAENADAESAGADAGPSCDGNAPNACGGCSTLANAPATSCGRCGVGRYACSGNEATSCVGGNDPAASPGGALLIDDLEDGDRFINAASGLSGSWYMVTDGTAGTLTPAAGSTLMPTTPGSGSARSMHLQGQGFTGWGAGLAASLNALGCSYDGSKQTGVSFSAKGSSNNNMIVSLATRQTVPTSEHGSCTANCNDHFRITLPLTASWTPRQAAFTALRQAGWGTAATFQPGELMYVQFSFPANTTFDLYVDTLSFY